MALADPEMLQLKRVLIAMRTELAVASTPDEVDELLERHVELFNQLNPAAQQSLLRVIRHRLEELGAIWHPSFGAEIG